MSRLRRLFARMLVGALFIGMLVGGAAFLHLRADQSKAAAAHSLTPIPVASVALEPVTGYDVVDRFVGRLEPAQQARIAFERGGLITAIAVEEGQTVARGEVIATLDALVLQAERDRLLGQRLQVAANLELSRLTEGRQRTLREQGHASQQRLDEARLNTAALEGELTALDAAIRRLDIDIEKSVVRAPFAGTVGARFVDTGVVVAAGTAVIDLLESDRPQARIGISPAAAAGLRPGDGVRLINGGEALDGRVVAVRPDVSTATRTVGVLIDVLAGPRASFGDTVELRVRRRVDAEGFWLPISALSEGERGLWSVLTIQSEDGETDRVGQEAVEVVHTDGDRVFVRGTLRPGQRVVAGGLNRIIPGQRIARASGDEGGP